MKHTYNARTETAAAKPSFRDAWKWAQHCIIPAEAFYEPDWRTGKPIPTRIARADGERLGIAGLWSVWRSPKGHEVHSYAMLTVKADEHPQMRMFHKPTDEKRMVVILPEERYREWLTALPEQSMALMHHSAAVALCAIQTSPINGAIFF